MPQLIATALIVVMVAALSVYGPEARSRRPAHLAAPEPAPVRPAADDPFSRLAAGLRTRRWARMLLTTTSIGLLVGAVGVVGYPFYTNLLQSRIQSRLDRQLASPELREAYLNREIAVGDSLTRIVIPEIDVDVVVVEGTTASALRAGAGHYPNTPLPCEIGNVAIAGHRTTYGAWFRHLDRLQPGDLIRLVYKGEIYNYEVEWIREIAANDWSVIAQTDEHVLTLTTCHPPGSSAYRLAVRARWIGNSQLPSGGPR